MRELQPAPYTPRPETIPPFRCGTPHAATLLLFSRERDSTRSRFRQSQCAALRLSIRRLIVASDLLPRTPRYSTPAVASIGGPAGLVLTALLLVGAVRAASSPCHHCPRRHRLRRHTHLPRPPRLVIAATLPEHAAPSAPPSSAPLRPRRCCPSRRCPVRHHLRPRRPPAWPATALVSPIGCRITFQELCAIHLRRTVDPVAPPDGAGEAPKHASGFSDIMSGRSQLGGTSATPTDGSSPRDGNV